MDDRMTVEQSIARLEDIVKQLGDSSVTLDDSLALYTEGMKLSEQCQTMLESAEQVVEQHARGAS